MEEDFAVYNFDSLEELDSSNTGLNGLYEEDDQGWDDEETFGTLEENGLDQQGNKPTIGKFTTSLPSPPPSTKQF